MDLLKRLTDIDLPDALDIALVAVFVYCLLAALQRIRVQRLAWVLVGLLMVYVAARGLQLQLTVYLFHVTAAALGLAFAIMYHNELRLVMERFIARLSRARSASRPDQRLPEWVPRLGDALDEMNRQKIGAIVVLQGHDDVSRYLTGGTRLDGIVSEPLLRSIFDPSSAGHDGAVVIVADRITRFSAHLPLSGNLEQLGDRGTRHAAALGLAERTDALCIVASEERGETSIAHEGALRAVGSPAELERAIGKFVAGLAGVRTERSPFWSWRRIRPVVASIVLAYALWFVFAHEAVTEYRSYVVPVKFVGLDPGIVVERADPAQVKVVVSGPRRVFYFVDEREIEMNVTLFDLAEGEHTLTLTASDVVRPDSLTFVNVFPRTLTVSLTAIQGESREE